MNKLRLLTPGPTMVPPEVTAAMAGPFDHHRTAEHRAIFRQVTADLLYVFQTSGDCCILTGSGTAAMEAAIAGVASPKSKALVFDGGKFGARWAKMCKGYGIANTVHTLEWGHGPKAEHVAQHLAADPSIDTVIVTHSETSTAAVADLQAIAAVTRQHDDCLLVVDGITSVGAIPLKMDEWGVDLVVTGSQKALMTPPGLAVAAVGPRAWKRIDSFATPGMYLCLKAYRKALADADSPYTPAITLMRGLRVALELIRAEGIENVWARTARLARATRAAAGAMGLRVFAADPVDSLTALLLPEGFDERTFRKRLRAEHGIVLAGGQDQLQGKAVRISHMGYVDECDTLGAIGAMELALRSMGRPIAPGGGLAAAAVALAS